MRTALRAAPAALCLAAACAQEVAAPALRPVVAAKLAQAADPPTGADCESAAGLARLASDQGSPWSLRAAFMDELARLDCDESLQALVALLDEGDVDARRRAALCIAGSGHDAAVPALLHALHDGSDPKFQAACALALAAHGNWSGAGASCFDDGGDDDFVGGCRVAIEQAAGSKLAEVRAAWCSTAALEALPRHEPSPRLVREWWRVAARLGATDEAERAAAARMLAGGDSALSLLLAQAAFDNDARLRDGALEALRALGARSEPAVLSLLPLLASPEARHGAARALGASCDPRARRALELALDAAADPAWRALLEAELRRLRAAGA